jgi:Ca2+-binding EF-hand superfamily protein
MRMEESLKGGVEQMKMIFDLCDHNSDGLIYAKDFREIGLQHFEKPEVTYLTGMFVEYQFCRP